MWAWFKTPRPHIPRTPQRSEGHSTSYNWLENLTRLASAENYKVCFFFLTEIQNLFCASTDNKEVRKPTSLNYGCSPLSNQTINFRHTLFGKKISPLSLFDNQPHMCSASSALLHSYTHFKDDCRKREIFISKYYNFWMAYLFLISSALMCSTRRDEQN